MTSYHWRLLGNLPDIRIRVIVAGLLREPKWSHLRDLHKAIKQSEWALISADPAVQSLGRNQEVWFQALLK